MFEWIAQVVTYDLAGLEEGSKLAAAVWFFVYDVLKILVLVFSVISVIAFLRTFLSPAKLKKSMSKLKFGLGNFAAALFGAVTPFCSCSSVPLFIGFVKARVPVGIAFSFLVTSPLVNEVAFVIMGGLFGWKLAFIYAASGIVLGVLAGVVIGKLKMDKEIIIDKGGNEEKRVEMNFKSGFRFRVRYALRDGSKTLKKLYPYVIGGVALGAVIHG
ncbi:permease, partial [Candidatus Peregrinibacteria bacterium]|nr:permease [Candidatus Peregrinibacteria bacterium]